MSVLTGPASPRIIINSDATLSRDCHTIVNALTIDNVSYDIDVDFFNGDKRYLESLIPKMQTIWAQMAEQALPPQVVSPRWEMECSYNTRSGSALVNVIDENVSNDVTDSIFLDPERLNYELNEPKGLFAETYAERRVVTAHNVMQAKRGVTAHNVMQYVNNQLMHPRIAYYSTGSSIPTSSRYLDAPSLSRANSSRPSTFPHRHLGKSSSPSVSTSRAHTSPPLTTDDDLFGDPQTPLTPPAIVSPLSQPQSDSLHSYASQPSSPHGHNSTTLPLLSPPIVDRSSSSATRTLSPSPTHRNLSRNKKPPRVTIPIEDLHSASSTRSKQQKSSHQPSSLLSPAAEEGDDLEAPLTPSPTISPLSSPLLPASHPPLSPTVSRKKSSSPPVGDQRFSSTQLPLSPTALDPLLGSSASSQPSTPQGDLDTSPLSSGVVLPRPQPNPRSSLLRALASSPTIDLRVLNLSSKVAGIANEYRRISAAQQQLDSDPLA